MITLKDKAGSEEKIIGNFSSIVVQLTVCSGSAMPFAPYSRLDNGAMDLLISPHLAPARALVFFDKLKKGGKHVHLKDVHYIRLGEVACDPKQRARLMVDGEFPGYVGLSCDCCTQRDHSAANGPTRPPLQPHAPCML